MTDPAGGEFPVRRRRRTRRHIRNRRIRRFLAVGTFLVVLAAASTLALKFLSPSLFRAQRTAPPNLEQVELNQNRAAYDQILAQEHPSADRPVYPYSVVPGGVQDAKELKWVAEHDPIVAAHYAGFDYDHARIVRLTLARTAYVSYRIGNRVYWTRHRITLHKGEKLITDGKMTARARCANRVEEAPKQAVAPEEPPAVKFDEPFPPGIATAMNTPPVPFQSALLERAVPGIGPMGPLSVYDPISGGGWVPVSPPPLPSGLCAPGKKKGTVDSGCCIAEVGVGKNKKGAGCGTSTIPEPGTWLMLASGLALIFWQFRRKLEPNLKALTLPLLR